ncbi:glycosyltransferase [Microbacterium sp. B2969]|uniref:Glycosyltransferase n=1 Tax=Microbacterium alkaliflavum TaxID=3248839 RepID=A0ABW7Q4A4_9MICO
MTAWDRAPVFDHLRALSDDVGVFEHARFDEPRRDLGYCVDDVARALIVLARERALAPDLFVIARRCLAFVVEAVAPDGRVHNRRTTDGRFTGRAGVGDWWGRAAWSLGVAFASLPLSSDTAGALEAFHRVVGRRPRHLRPMAFCALGAADVVRILPRDRAARDVLRDAAEMIRVQPDSEWPWPEPRLHYANAVLPEAVLAAGAALHDAKIIERGLEMLSFLLKIETSDGHLSVTGTQGRGPHDHGPQFDQQPIEVAAIADACARAFRLTGDERWRDAIVMAWAWFTGGNDGRTPLFDPETGAGYDGLTPHGRNENRGAESTLAMLSTYQQARRLGVLSTVGT